jgi:hypothetical protein
MSKTQIFMLAGETFQIKSATCHLLEMAVSAPKPNPNATDAENALAQIHSTADFIQEALASSGYILTREFIMRNLRLDEIQSVLTELNNALGLVGKPTANP